MCSFQSVPLSIETRRLLQSRSEERVAVTFAEVTLEDQPSNVHPNDVTLETFVTRTIALRGAGIMSAAM